LIVDDHAVVRQGLRTFIDLQDDMQVVAEGSDGGEALDLVERFTPDIVLLDLVMPNIDGVAATQRIKAAQPSTRVLILSRFGEDERVFAAIRAGAMGYLLKDMQPKDLIHAIREAFQGKVQLHPTIVQKLMQVVSTPAVDREAAAMGKPAPASPPFDPNILAPGNDHLTERELDVLRLIAQGLNNREIAGKMVISERTVKTHVSNILGKLGLEDRTQAAIWAIKHGAG